MCSEKGCEKPIHSKGLCQAHYRQMRRREADPAVGTRKPGPQRDPSKPYSKYRPAKPVVRDETIQCPQGHPYDDANTYLDPYGYKQCRACRRERRRDNYVATPENRGRANREKTHCPKGHEYTPENTYVNKGKRCCRICSAEKSFLNNVAKFGITLEQYTQMLEDQDYLCAICLTDFDASGRRPDVDHDHRCCPPKTSCGRCVRGLLCRACNHGIGLLGDTDVRRLMRAATYVSRNNTRLAAMGVVQPDPG